MMDGPGLPAPDVVVSEFGIGGVTSDSVVGLGCCGMLADLIRVNVFGVMDWPASGEAVSIVPAVATGAGCGLEGRNKG